MRSRNKLMIPGPVDVWEDTLETMGQPITPHYGDEWIRSFWETVDLVKRVFQTERDVYILISSGSGAIDACLGSMYYTGEKVAVVCNGPFANRTLEILEGYGIAPVRIEGEWGKAISPAAVEKVLEANRDVEGLAVVANETGTGVVNPIRELAEMAHAHDIPIFVDAVSAMGGYDLPVDQWGLDAVVTSANKCLESPPGVGLLTLSERAWELVEAKAADRHHGWYMNLSTWKGYVDSPVWGKWHPYPVTMATSVILALRTSLKRILEEETLPGHWSRFTWAQRIVRKGLRAVGFEMVAVEEDASPTVTSIWKREDMEVSELVEFMESEHGFMIAGATGDLAGRVFRISHMGKASTKDYLIPCLLGIEEFLRRRKGVDIPVGASLIGLADDDRWY